MNALHDLTGLVFSRLTVLSSAGKYRLSGHLWNCICSCGNTSVVHAKSLKNGTSKSCGCLRKELSGMRAKRHGMKGTRVYASWGSMLSRCRNKNATGYERYGGRGIDVCKRWESFDFFYEDMGDPPKGKTLDRLDVNLSYCKENCRWATDVEQGRNKRTNVLLTAFGQTRTVAEWAEISGISYGTFYSRIQKPKWSIEKAITEPLRKQ